MESCFRPRLLVLLGLASCGQGGLQQATPANRVILPASTAREVLDQCSRAVPSTMDGTWEPTDSDINAMEAILPRVLASHPEARQVDFSDLLKGWQRQYVGTVRGGKRFVYGNYFPISDTNEMVGWREQPMIVCDGGPQFFGAEFDISAKRITRIDFNGSIG